MKPNQDNNDRFGGRRDGDGRSGGRRDDARPSARNDYSNDRRGDSRSDRPANRDTNRSDDRRPFNRDERPYKPFNRDERTGDRPERSRSFDRDSSERRPFDRDRSSDRNNDRSENRSGDRNERPRSFDRDNRSQGAGRSFDRDRPGDRNNNRSGDRSDNRFGDRRDEQRPFRRDRDDNTNTGRFNDRRDDRDSARPRSFDRDRNNDRSDNRSGDRSDRPRPPYSRDDRNERTGDRPERPRSFDRDSSERRPFDRDRSGDRTERLRSFDRDNRSQGAGRSFDRDRSGDRNSNRSENRSGDRFDNRPERSAQNEGDEPSFDRRTGRYNKAPNYNLDIMKKNLPRTRKVAQNLKRESDPDSIRLNRYIANAGVCSRREADELIGKGDVQVNGKVVTEMGYRVKPGDVVKYGNKVLNPEKMVYVLLNKPKDFITTTDDPEERNTVMDLIADAGPYRLYPVGRLDRNTTGLLLMTNDGELAGKLTHPSHNVKKVYQVELDKPISEEHFEIIRNGIELEDGFIKPDDVAIVTPDAYVVGVEIHSGRNRIVRRLFESQGYEVMKLDRTVFASLTKKELPRGKWRFLEPKEVVKLKYLS